MKLSVIMPVYNEEKTVSAAVKKILLQRVVHEVIIVNDGSTDKTPTILKKLAQQHPRRIKLLNKKNEGKGSAICLGLKKVTGNYILIQDADLEYDPRDIKYLLEPIKNKQATVVYGSRFLGPHANLLFWHKVGNQLLNLLTNVLYNTTLSDLETCYKVIPTQLLRELDLCSNDFKIEPEITCKLLKRGVRIFETPISYYGRDFSEGKKMNWKHGFGAVWTIIRLRLFN